MDWESVRVYSASLVVRVNMAPHSLRGSTTLRVTPSHSESLRVTPSHSESLRVTPSHSASHSESSRGADTDRLAHAADSDSPAGLDSVRVAGRGPYFRSIGPTHTPLGRPGGHVFARAARCPSPPPFPDMRVRGMCARAHTHTRGRAGRQDAAAVRAGLGDGRRAAVPRMRRVPPPPSPPLLHRARAFSRLAVVVGRTRGGGFCVGMRDSLLHPPSQVGFRGGWQQAGRGRGGEGGCV